jgi:hypothetical protein
MAIGSNTALMSLSLTLTLTTATAVVSWAQAAAHSSGLLAVLDYGERKNDIFNILWALVFGFATLNILSLVGRKYEPQRSRLSFGEAIAILVVVVSIVLLGWELLTLFHVFPIKLQLR